MCIWHRLGHLVCFDLVNSQQAEGFDLLWDLPCGVCILSNQKVRAFVQICACGVRCVKKILFFSEKVIFTLKYVKKSEKK